MAFLQLIDLASQNIISKMAANLVLLVLYIFLRIINNYVLKIAIKIKSRS